jgi:hypothetical protein
MARFLFFNGEPTGISSNFLREQGTMARIGVNTLGAFTPPNPSLIRRRNSETDPDLRCLIRR